jgi:hypothetical protein
MFLNQHSSQSPNLKKSIQKGPPTHPQERLGDVIPPAWRNPLSAQGFRAFRLEIGPPTPLSGQTEVILGYTELARVSTSLDADWSWDISPDFLRITRDLLAVGEAL